MRAKHSGVVGGRSPAVLLLLFLLPACGLFSGDDGLLPAPSLGPTTAVDYRVAVTGLPEQPPLAGLIAQSARTYTQADRPPPSLARLVRRAEGDVAIIERILRAEGFYLGSVAVDLDADAVPAVITFAVTPGPRFTIGAFAVMDPDGAAAPAQAPPLDSLLPPLGMPARGADIVAAEEAVVAWYRDHGFPYARFVDRTARADVEAATLAVTSRIDRGPLIFYGDVRITGTVDVEPPYLERFVAWQPGTPVAQSDLDALQRDLIDTGLFDGVRVGLPEAAPEAVDGEPVTVPVTIAVDEDDHRTIGGGLRYSTADGAGARAVWEHRNLLGQAERLRATLDVGTIERSASLAFTIPRFLVPERSFVSEVSVVTADDEVAEEIGIETFAGVRQTLSPSWTVGVGAELEAAELTDGSGTRRSYLFGLPAFGQYDTTDDLLDPTRGMRLRLTATPASGVFDGAATSFVTVESVASHYINLSSGHPFVLAGRARLGSIVGEARDDIPVNRRLFSGGGGSVRAYETSFIGPLDAAGDPLGGRSVVEAGIELRTRVTESIGLVPFFEAGAVSADMLPDLEDGLRLGAGLGARYYSAIGPLRLDVAVPVNPRDRDDSFQAYISIGQAF